MSRIALVLLAIVVAFTGVFLLTSCGSSSSPTSNAAAVNVMVSDPATCSNAPSGFSHIFVTITDVEIHTSSTAGPNDPGWVDLTPNLKQNPMQVDLLAQANNQCFLATLGSTMQIQPGTFQQIRIFLAANTTAPEGNKCGSAANCVMLNSSPSTPQPLLLSSESQTGIKIPAGQIAGGQFVVAAGQTKDLDIDILGCESIVDDGNGQFRLKPVLHAGEVSLTSSSINGKVVNGANGQPIAGGTILVALEQPQNTAAGVVDRVVMATLADSTGAFVFCPVNPGTYDVVAVAFDGTQEEFGATVIAGVQPGNALGTVPLTIQAGPNKSFGSITGQVTTSTGTAATVAAVAVSALQQITINGGPVLVTIPLAAQSVPGVAAKVTTAASASCPANTDCATYTLLVPVANPSVGAFSTSGTQNPGPPAGATVNYTVDANAPTCSTSDAQTNLTTASAPLSVTAGTTVTAAKLALSGCP